MSPKDYQRNSGLSTNPSEFDYFQYIKAYYERREVSQYFDDFFKLVNFRNAIILDVGCGTGHVSKRLQRLGNYVISLDINSYLLKYGKTDNPLLGSAYALPIKERSVDAVFFLDIVEHLGRPQVGLNEVRRVLKKAGYLFLITPNGLWSRLIFRGRSSDPTHIHEYSWLEIRSILEKSRFVITTTMASGLPLIGRISPKASRKMAKLLRKIALPIAVSSFWIVARRATS